MIGFIGYGSMGGALVRAFLSHGVSAKDVAINTRSPNKLQTLLAEYPNISVVSSEEISSCDVLFLCVRSGDALDVLRGLSDFKGHLVSINGGISLTDICSIHNGPVTKAMPSLTVEAGRGVTLLCHSEECQSSQIVEELFSKVCKVVMLPEQSFEDAENITGCSPAFFAKFALQLAEGSNLSLSDAKQMAKETLIATAMLLEKSDISLEQLISDVATSGGITEKGLAVMDEKMPPAIKKMFESMH